MAYPISNDVLQLFKSGALQKVQMTVNAQNSTYTLTNADLKENTLIIDRATVSGQAIEIGSTIASELSFVLDNYDGRFNNYIFEGADIAVSVGVTNSSGATTYVPMGYFTVDTQPRRLKEISIYALDRMMQFDKPVGAITYPLTVAALLRNICSACNVTLYTVPENLPNGTYTISAAPESEDLTYRQLLQWIAQITGTCAYFDWNGNLRLEWYSSTSAATITTADRFTSDLYESPIEITGVQVNIGETSYLSGEGAYALLIEGNELIQDNPQNVANALSTALTGFTYTPFSCETLPLPHLYPLDRVTFVDSQGVSHSTIITNAAFSLNGRTTLQGSGETATLAGYASANPLTNREQVIIKNIANQAANATLGTFEQATLELNETIAGSMGLYTTVITNEDGSKTTYFHSKPELTESVAGDVIYTWLAGGFAYTTTGWNNGSPVWQYGFTADGNSVLKVLTAYGINADWINAGAITIKDAEGNTTFSADTQTGVVNINGTDGNVTFTNTPINLSASQTYLASNYTTADMDRVREIMLGNITPTEADYEKYDFYGDGEITNVDWVITRNLVLGMYGDSLTVAWHCAIDPNNKARIFRVWRSANSAETTVFEIGASGVSSQLFANKVNSVLVTDGVGYITSSSVSVSELERVPNLTYIDAGTVTAPNLLTWASQLTSSSVFAVDPNNTTEGLPEEGMYFIGRVTIENPYGRTLELIPTNSSGAVYINKYVGGQWIGWNSGSVSVTANAVIPVNIRQGELFEFSFFAEDLSDGDVTLLLNATNPSVGGYTYTGSNTNYAAGIITRTGGYGYASFSGFIQIISDRAIMWGSGWRASGDGFGWANAVWIGMTTVHNLAFNKSGVLRYKRI